MNNNIEDLKKDFKSFQESDNTLKNHMELLNICDVLLNNFPDELRKEPFYNLSLDVINELMSLRVGIGSTRMYEDTDLDTEIIIREMNLLKKVAPADEKMQKVITRLFIG
jgi:hypothetical protein